MRHFLKVFLITFFISILLVMVGFYSYLRVFNPLNDIISANGIDIEDDDDNAEDSDATPFENAVKNSKRINVLVVGLEHVRTDTIMVASYDTKNKIANIISIPRDTLYERPGYKSNALKINAIYQDENIGGLIDAVQKILNIRIDKYITVDYKAVIEGIDVLGGVEIDIPFHMKYTDPSDNPPLIIDIPEGRRLLDGNTSLKFLRFRKGDSGYADYPNGDIGRIQAQQMFVKEAVKKLLSLKLPNFIHSVYPYVKTNFSTTQLLALATELAGFSMENLNTDILPGTGEWIDDISFYVPKNEEIVKLIYTMYGLLEEENNSGTSE